MSQAPAFNTVAEPQTGYVFDYDREVAQFYHDHPDQKDRIIFVERSAEGTRIVRDMPDRDNWVWRLNNNTQALKFMNDYANSNITAMAEKCDDGFYLVLMRSDGKNYKAPTQKKTPMTQEMRHMLKAFIFDHEIGHILCMFGFVGGNYSECTADAYATARHVQRFGVDTGLSELRLQALAVSLFTDDRDKGHHFTSPVIDLVMRHARKGAFTDIPPRDLPQLIPPLVSAAHPNNDFIMAAGDMMMPETGNHVRDMSMFVQKILSTDDPDILKWGIVAINAFKQDAFRLKGQTETFEPSVFSPTEVSKKALRQP